MAYYPGYSKEEYVSAVVDFLVQDYGLSSGEASNLVYDSSEVRFYGGGYAGMGRGGNARAPSAQANAIAKEKRLRKVPRRGPPMESGYAYAYVGRGDWDTVMVGEDEINKAVFQGFTRIDGMPHAVWRVGRKLYAQTAVGGRHPSHWRS
jgi:hypothetical protein